MTSTPATAPRADLYAVIHKTLRLAMTDTLVRLGSLDIADPGPRQETLAQLAGLLDMLRSHVDKEEHIVHPLIEARCPGVSGRIAGEHVEHRAAIDRLEAELVALQCAPDADAAHRLYRHLARFVAENLEHMEVEESVHNAALWSAYSDDELMAVHHAIVASLGPEESGRVLHWMLPAMSHAERVGMLTGLRAEAPPPVFDGLMQLARRRLPAGEWAKLEQAIEPLPLAA